MVGENELEENMTPTLKQYVYFYTFLSQNLE
jgi:hypothetical protein